MNAESHLTRPPHRFKSIGLTLAIGAAWIAAFPTARAQAGSLIVPAWSFARGNVRINANPDEFADAGPVVVSGERAPWGWRVEYDIDIPVTAVYRLYIKYATTEARPVEVYFDTRNVSKTCTGISLDSHGKPTLKSSGARWELLRSRFGGPDPVAAKRNGPATAGRHTIVLTSRQPLPHLVALRLDTQDAFPDDWTPPKFKVHDIQSVPAKYRGALPRRATLTSRRCANRPRMRQPPAPRERC